MFFRSSITQLLFCACHCTFPFFSFLVNSSIFTRADASAAKELRSQPCQEQIDPVSQTLPHLPLTAATKSSSEAPAAPKPGQALTSAASPSVPESPTMKRSENPFRRGVYGDIKFEVFKLFDFVLNLLKLFIKVRKWFKMAFNPSV